MHSRQEGFQNHSYRVFNQLHLTKPISSKRLCSALTFCCYISPFLRLQLWWCDTQWWGRQPSPKPFRVFCWFCTMTRLEWKIREERGLDPGWPVLRQRTEWSAWYNPHRALDVRVEFLVGDSKIGRVQSYRLFGSYLWDYLPSARILEREKCRIWTKTPNMFVARMYPSLTVFWYLRQAAWQPRLCATHLRVAIFGRELGPFPRQPAAPVCKSENW